MNNQEIISRIEELGSQVVAIDAKNYEIEDKYDQVTYDFIASYLNQYNVLENGFYLECNKNYFIIKRCRENESHGRDVITISAYDKWFRNENEDRIERLDTSFYSTSENSKFELERMVVIGKVGQMLLDNYDVILKGVNVIYKDRADELSLPLKEKWELNRQINELEKIKKELEKQELFDILKNGVEFEVEEFRHMQPSLKLRVKDDVNVTYLKVLNTKGKSVFIEYKGWSDKIYTDKTKIENIEHFVSYYQNKIKNSLETVVA
jgi:hypothetical protein